MSLNGVSPAVQAYIDKNSGIKKEEVKNTQKNYLEDNSTLDSVELSTKEKGIKSFGKGILYTIGLSIPFLSEYLLGNMANNQQEAAEIVKDLKDGDIDNEVEKKGVGSKFAKGVISSVVALIPFIGTYMVGKHKYERENLAQNIQNIKEGKEVQKPEKKGVIRTFFKGLWESIKMIIPIYNFYYIGKEAANMKNLNQDAKNFAEALD